MSGASADKNLGLHSLSVAGNGYIKDLTSGNIALSEYDRISGTGALLSGISANTNVVLSSPTITGSSFSTSDNTTFTVSKGGVYALNIYATFIDAALLAQCSLLLYKNNSLFLANDLLVTAGTDASYDHTASWTVFLSAGDTFRFVAFRDVAGNVSFPHIEIVRML